MSQSDLESRLTALEVEIAGLKSAFSKQEEASSREVDSSLGSETKVILAQVRQNEFPQIPTYALTCRPKRKVEMVNLFAGVREPLVKLFDNPPETRDAGFGLINLSRSSVIVAGGAYRLLSAKGYQARFLTRSGIFGAIAAGTENFLAWAMPNAHGSRTIRINPVTLAEFTFSFCSTARDLMNYASAPTSSVELGLELSGFDENSATVALPSTRMSPSLMVSSLPSSTPGETNRRIVKDTSLENDPSYNALELVKELYISFNYEGDIVPYSDGTKFDIRAIVPTI